MKDYYTGACAATPALLSEAFMDGLMDRMHEHALPADARALYGEYAARCAGPAPGREAPAPETADAADLKAALALALGIQEEV